MEKLKNHIAALPAITVGGKSYLSYQVVTDAVAAADLDHNGSRSLKHDFLAPGGVLTPVALSSSFLLFV